MAPPRPLTLTLIVVTAVVSVSTAAILIRLSDAPALVIAFYRLLFATLLLAPVALARRDARAELRALSGRDWLVLSGVGVVLAIHFASWITSLALTSVAASVVLVTMHPVLVGLVSGRLFGEGLAGTAWVGVVVAFAGSAVIALGDSARGPDPLLGDFLAFVGALAAAAYFLAGRGFRQRLGLLAYVVPVYAACAVTLLLMALAAGSPLTGWPLREYVLYLAMAVVPMILGHTLLNYALKYVTAPVIATTILGEPVGSTILALVILAEVPPAATLAGGVLVLAGIGLVVLRERAGRRAVKTEAV